VKKTLELREEIVLEESGALPGLKAVEKTLMLREEIV
jgi:hypothetical protein